jgi:ADP-dependent NAD(P)H-hydrate dehydratase / NAD(P)H-hydrate epimerase
MMARVIVRGVIAPAVLAAMTLWLLPSIGTGAAGDQNQFVQQTSSRSYVATIASLKRAVSSNGMMVLGDLDQQSALSMTGLHLGGAHAFFVGNPQVGKQLFQMDPAAGAELPARVYVWVDNAGATHVGYFQPSARLAAINPQFAKPGVMFDQKLAKIVSDTVGK